jgi:uncharacterized protein with HEPN domain
MPLRDPGVYLEDIEYYADAAVRFVAQYSLEQYLADEKTRGRWSASWRFAGRP